jgi:glycosyltransferase involved in cell wall biosynthesis
MKLSIIIPVFNEERTIIEILEKVNEFKKDNSLYEIIIINDGSKDKTLDLLKDNNHLYNNLITYEKNKGKGYAVKEGLKFSKGEYVIFQDADLEYDPIEIQGFIDLIEKFKPDGAIGSRFVYNKYTRSHYFLNKIGNKLLTLIFNIFYNTTFTDIYSCYFCFKKSLLDDKN